MDDSLDLMLGDQGGDERLVASVTDNKRGALRYRPIETGCKIVEHHDALAGIKERVNHVASDIAGAAGDQDRHAGAFMSFGVAAGDSRART